MKIDRPMGDASASILPAGQDGAAIVSQDPQVAAAAPSTHAEPEATLSPNSITRAPRAKPRRKSTVGPITTTKSTSGASDQGGPRETDLHSGPAAPKRRRAKCAPSTIKAAPGGALSIAGQPVRDDQCGTAGKGEVGPAGSSTAAGIAPDLAQIIADIRTTYARRRALHKAEKGMILTLKAKARSAAVFRLRAAGQALPAGKFAEATAADTAQAEATFPEIVAARDVLAEGRAACEKRLRALAKLLPVWTAWGQGIKGFGELSLAIVVGEAGDLAEWRSLGGLRKHLGLAVIDGRAQRRVRDAEQAKRQGYNPERRSAIYTIGDSCCVKVDGPYRQVYRDRKAYEQARNDALPEVERLTKMHLHRRAQRYAEKLLIKHLWQAWRRAHGAAADIPALKKAA